MQNVRKEEGLKTHKMGEVWMECDVLGSSLLLSVWSSKLDTQDTHHKVLGMPKTFGDLGHEKE